MTATTGSTAGAARVWPGEDWESSPPGADVDSAQLVDALARIAATHDGSGEDGVSLATVVVHRGRVVAEQYGPETDAATTLISWSMAKSFTSVVFGLLVGDGLVDIGQRADVPEWAGTDKAAITVGELLAMRSGLEFVEDYVDDSISHCIDMLFGSGQDDHAHYAASLPLLHPPGSVWNYSSGTTNILARLATDIIVGSNGVSPVDRQAAMERFLHDRLFGPLGMESASPKFDAAGNFVGSSYVYATARDFARFGYFALNDGVWQDERLLPEGWIDASRGVLSIDDTPPHFGYGLQWWVWRDEPSSIAAHGYEGQYTVAVPDRDLVVVQLSKVSSERRPKLLAELSRIVASFPRSA